MQNQQIEIQRCYLHLWCRFYKGRFALGILLYLPGVVIFTPIYIFYVVLTFVYNFIWPEWIQDENEEKTFIMFKVEFPFGTLSQYV